MNFLQLEQLVYDNADLEELNQKLSDSNEDVSLKLEYVTIDRNAKILPIVIVQGLEDIISISPDYPVKREKDVVNICTIKMRKYLNKDKKYLTTEYDNIVGTPKEIIDKINEHLKTMS